jgi:hypothetical protein
MGFQAVSKQYFTIEDALYMLLSSAITLMFIKMFWLARLTVAAAS